MILHKFWSAFVAQINKIANLFWEADPVAQIPKLRLERQNQ